MIALVPVTEVRLDKSTDVRLEQPSKARYNAVSLEIVVNPDKSTSTSEVQLEKAYYRAAIPIVVRLDKSMLSRLVHSSKAYLMPLFPTD